MPHEINTSNISIFLDPQDRLIHFDLCATPCGKKIERSALSAYCKGKPLEELVQIKFLSAAQALNCYEEKKQFMLYVEWAALRSAIAQYLDLNEEKYDKQRCQIVSVKHDPQGTTVEEIVLPPKELPQIPSACCG
ncbi:MAG: hypothetical protein ABIJ41_07025 [Candidatus Omnitrophota bacterium]